MSEYTEGVCDDGAAILKDGAQMTISEVLAELNDKWKMVPMEPTLAMIAAGFKPLSDLYERPATTGMAIRAVAADCYRAMINASPERKS